MVSGAQEGVKGVYGVAVAAGFLLRQAPGVMKVLEFLA